MPDAVRGGISFLSVLLPATANRKRNQSELPATAAIPVVFWRLERTGALALGIAIQNFPEGAIVSMPLLAEGMPRQKTFRMGVLSGAVEPAAAVVTLLAAGLVTPVMPYFLAFAAGAMMYVVVEELIPEMSEGKHSNIGTVAFALGFVVMMILDVTLG